MHNYIVNIKSIQKVYINMFALILSAILFAITLPVNTMAESMTAEKWRLCVDGGEMSELKVINVSYENNAYLSLKDIQAALVGTDKSFSIVEGGGDIRIYTKGALKADNPDELDLINAAEEAEFAEAEDAEVNEETLLEEEWGEANYGVITGGYIAGSKLYIDDAEVRYYYVVKDDDYFFVPLDLGMILNVLIEVDNETAYIATDKGFAIDPEQLEMQDYFFDANSVLAGDASTGEIFYAYAEETPFAIASTTKLMTYLLIKEGIANGEIGIEDSVTVPAAAAKLSQNGDAVMQLKEGQQASMKDLLYALLLPSSNEAALTLATHLCGSEEEFVKRMNEKAETLGMETASFYNCNGLPVYTNDEGGAKHQNNMTSADMFKLASYILNTYPEVTEITATRKATLSTLGNREVKNTNGLLYNMPEVNGLKTGTTTKSGACLVSSLKVNDGTLDHDLVVVVLGAEDGKSRVRLSQVLATYAKGVVQGTMAARYNAEPEKEPEKPVSAGAIVSFVVNKAVKSK